MPRRSSLESSCFPDQGFECGDCGKSCKSKSSLNKHISSYHDGRVYICLFCDSQNQRKNRHVEHLRRFHPNQLIGNVNDNIGFKPRNPGIEDNDIQEQRAIIESLRTAPSSSPSPAQSNAPAHPAPGAPPNKIGNLNDNIGFVPQNSGIEDNDIQEQRAIIDSLRTASWWSPSPAQSNASAHPATAAPAAPPTEGSNNEGASEKFVLEYGEGPNKTKMVVFK